MGLFGFGKNKKKDEIEKVDESINEKDLNILQ